MSLPIQKTKRKQTKSSQKQVQCLWAGYATGWQLPLTLPLWSHMQVLMMFYSTDQLCTADSLTYNPLISAVDFRVTRSLLTASERSTASGITTGIIGSTAWETRS